MGGTELSVGRVGVVVALVGVIGLFLAGVWILASGGGGPLALAALVLPALVVVAPLVYLAREVGSEADDPEEVEERLAEGLGLSKAEFDRRHEGEGDRYAHPAEREFEAEE
jgi:hypothetical protein